MPSFEEQLESTDVITKFRQRLDLLEKVFIFVDFDALDHNIRSGWSKEISKTDDLLKQVDGIDGVINRQEDQPEIEWAPEKLKIETAELDALALESLELKIGSRSASDDKEADAANTATEGALNTLTK